MKITTKAVFDIESGVLLHRESYEYDGPVDLCGSIFSNLTKPQIQDNGQSTTYDNAAQAGQALAADMRRIAQPSTSAVNGTITPDPSTDVSSVANVPAPPVPMPRLTTPSFSDVANGPGGWTNSGLTTKGHLLALALQGMVGAASGAAASMPINGGRTSVGWGPGMAAGFQAPFQQAEMRAELAKQEQDRQFRAAQIAALPQQQELDRRLKQSEIDARNAQASRRENYTVPGVGLVTPDESSPNGYKVVVAEPSKGKALDSPDERSAYLTQIDPKGELLSPRERQGYIATGSWPKETADHAPSLLQWIADSNSPDPNVSQPAKRNLSAYRANTVETHQEMRDPGEDGLSAAQARRLNADPNYSALKLQRQNLLKAQAELSAYSPEAAGRLGEQISALTQQMQTSQASILKKNGGFTKLTLGGPVPSHQPTQAQATPATHVFNVSTWKAANPKGDVNAAIAYAKQQGFQVIQ